MITYQDFEGKETQMLQKVIDEHLASKDYSLAVLADLYDHQRNKTILDYAKVLYTITGSPVVDFTAANNKITSNYFRRLNTQRNTYLLGNGVMFENDSTEEKLGNKFDTQIKKAGYKALIHGVTFCFWNLDHLRIFPLTEFAPIWDEDTGALRAGIRFWQIDKEKPMYYVLYTEQGYQKFKKNKGDPVDISELKPYKTKVRYTPADGDVEIGGENYGSLPIVPLWGSELHQSTLVGMQQSIDSYDLIRSGFANDLEDCALIYWIIENAGGMDEKDLAQFRDQLKFLHIANVDSDDGAGVSAHTQDLPYEARSEYLDRIRKGIYEDFGAFDVREMSAAAKTATEINAAYQPLDEEADDYEYQIIEAVQQILKVAGLPDDTPKFTRNRIANQLEQVQMLALQDYVDDQTKLEKSPNIKPDEVAEIMERKRKEELERFTTEE